MQQNPQQNKQAFEFQQFLVGHYSFITQFSIINPVRHIKLELFMENNDLIRQWKEQKERQQQKEQQQQEDQQVINQTSQIQQQENNGRAQSQMMQTQNNSQTQNTQSIYNAYSDEQIKDYFQNNQQKYQIEQIIKFKDKKYLPKIRKQKQQEIEKEKDKDKENQKVRIKTKQFLVSAGQDGSILFWNIQKQMKAYQKNYEEAQKYHQRKLQQLNKLKLDYVHQNPFQQLQLKEQEMYKYGKYAPLPFEQGVINNACNCISNTDEIIVGGFADGNVMQWTVFFEEQNGKTEIQYTFKQLFSHNDEVNCIDLLQLNHRLLVASGSKDQSIIVQNFSSNNKCEKYQYHLESSVNQIKFLSHQDYQEVYCLTDNQIAIMKFENRLNNDYNQDQMFEFLIEKFELPFLMISRFQLFNNMLFLLNILDQSSELITMKLKRDTNVKQTEDKIIYFYINESTILVPQFKQIKKANQDQNEQILNEQSIKNTNSIEAKGQIEYVNASVNHKSHIVLNKEKLSKFTSWFHYDNVDRKLYTFDDQHFIIFKVDDPVDPNKLINKFEFEIQFNYDQIYFKEQNLQEEEENERQIEFQKKFKSSHPYNTAIKTQKFYNGTTWFLGGDLLGKYLLE